MITLHEAQILDPDGIELTFRTENFMNLVKEYKVKVSDETAFHLLQCLKRTEQRHLFRVRKSEVKFSE